MTSVTPGYLIHDISNRKSSRVLNRPGGESNMNGIFGDSNAKFDDGRGSATRGANNNNQPHPHQQQFQPPATAQYSAPAPRHQPQQQQQQQQYSAPYGYDEDRNNYRQYNQHQQQQQFQPKFTDAREIKNRNQSSSVFDSNFEVPMAPSRNVNSASYNRRNQSDVFHNVPSPARPQKQQPPQQQYQQQPPRRVAENTYTSQQPQQQYAPEKKDVHTSIKIHRPPGGDSSISFGDGNARFDDARGNRAPRR